MNWPELKPCPFCGGSAMLIQTWSRPEILCRKCGATKDGARVDRLVKAWNKRRPPDPTNEG